MPKRLADTKLLDQSWFLDLPFESKMMWLFLERSCDHAGIWEIDIPQMRRKLGSPSLSLSSFLEDVNRDYSKVTGEQEPVNRVMLICNNTKLWVTGFISEQYGKGLKGLPNNAVIKSALNRLKDEGIYEFAIKEGLVRVQNSADESTPETEVSDILQFDPQSSEPAPHPVDIHNNSSLSNEEKSDVNEEIDPLNIPSSEPFERVKDKDKDKDKEIMYGSSSYDFKGKGSAEGKTKVSSGELTPQQSGTQEISVIGVDSTAGNPATADNSNSDNCLIADLFKTHWGKRFHTPQEEVLTAQLILDYGADEVKIAFTEAVKHNRLTLAYIKGILQKRRTKQEQQKAEEAKKQERLRMSLKAEEEKQNGVKLGLIESVYGVPSK